MNAPIPAAIIGAGRAGERHAEAMRFVPWLHLRGFFDTSRDMATSRARQFRCAVFRTLKEACDAARDGLVIIATPPAAHGLAAAAALAAGCHVLVEKPLDVDLSWIDRLDGDSSRFGRIASAVSQHRFSAAFQALLRQPTGDTTGADVRVQRRRSSEQIGASWRSRQQIAGGGALLSIGFHYVDLLCTLLEGPVAVQTASASATEGIDAVTVADVEIGGVACHIDVRWGEIEEYRDRLTLHTHMTRTTLIGDGLPGLPAPAKLQLLAAQQQDVASAITENREPAIRVRDVRRPLELIDAIYAAAGVRS